MENIREIEQITNQKYKNVIFKFVELDKVEYKLNLITHNPPCTPAAKYLGRFHFAKRVKSCSF